MTDKEKVLAVFPHAQCVRSSRKKYYVPSAMNRKWDEATEYVRYVYDIVTESNASLSVSVYSEEGAWEYAWKFIESEMLNKLES